MEFMRIRIYIYNEKSFHFIHIIASMNEHLHLTNIKSHQIKSNRREGARSKLLNVCRLNECRQHIKIEYFICL